MASHARRTAVRRVVKREFLATILRDAAPLDLRIVGRTLLHAALVGVVAGPGGRGVLRRARVRAAAPARGPGRLPPAARPRRDVPARAGRGAPVPPVAAGAAAGGRRAGGRPRLAAGARDARRRRRRDDRRRSTSRAASCASASSGSRRWRRSSRSAPAARAGARGRPCRSAARSARWSAGVLRVARASGASSWSPAWRPASRRCSARRSAPRCSRSRCSTATTSSPTRSSRRSSPASSPTRWSSRSSASRRCSRTRRVPVRPGAPPALRPAGAAGRGAWRSLFLASLRGGAVGVAAARRCRSGRARGSAAWRSGCSACRSSCSSAGGVHQPGQGLGLLRRRLRRRADGHQRRRPGCRSAGRAPGCCCCCALAKIFAASLTIGSRRQRGRLRAVAGDRRPLRRRVRARGAAAVGRPAHRSRRLRAGRHGHVLRRHRARAAVGAGAGVRARRQLRPARAADARRGDRLRRAAQAHALPRAGADPARLAGAPGRATCPTCCARRWSPRSCGRCAPSAAAADAVAVPGDSADVDASGGRPSKRRRRSSLRADHDLRAAAEALLTHEPARDARARCRRGAWSATSTRRTSRGGTWRRRREDAGVGRVSQGLPSPRPSPADGRDSPKDARLSQGPSGPLSPSAGEG